MKSKILSYVFVVMISVGSTLATIYFTQNQHYSTITTSADDSSNFHFADYKGNYAVEVPDFVDAANKSVNAVVSIKKFSGRNSRSRSPFEDFFFGFPFEERQRDPNMPDGSGSGVIISNDGYIATNNHVINGAEKLEVTLNNQKSYTAEIVGTDPNTDIALLKIEEKGLPFLKFINSDEVKVGDWVLAVGNPFGLNSTVTAGIVSYKGRSIDILRRNGSSPVESFIQTDAAINPGNSGGALINPAGDLVGINTAISSPTGSYSGYGFAVPSNLVKKVVDDIKQYGLVQRAYIGINYLDLSNEEMVRAYNREKKASVDTREGVMVIGLSDDGGAIEAGIEEGDIITEIDGRAVKNFANMSFIIGNKRPGDKVEVKLLRDGKERTYKVTLKDQRGNAKVRTKDDLTVEEVLGAEFEPLTDRQKINYGLKSGLLVAKVEPNGKFREIGIRENFILLEINGKEVVELKDVERLTKNEETISISFMDEGGRIYRRGFKMD